MFWYNGEFEYGIKLAEVFKINLLEWNLKHWVIVKTAFYLVQKRSMFTKRSKVSIQIDLLERSVFCLWFVYNVVAIAFFEQFAWNSETSYVHGLWMLLLNLKMAIESKMADVVFGYFQKRLFSKVKCIW